MHAANQVIFIRLFSSSITFAKFLCKAITRSDTISVIRTMTLRQPRLVVARCFSRDRSSVAGSSNVTNAATLLDELVNHERSGIPAAAGTASSSRFDLGRMHRLLAAMGNPHLALKAVHVAGSKGKGSTVSLLATILTAAGYRTGAYTSPHLLALEERIAVGHPGGTSPRPRPVAPDDLAFLAAHHADAIRQRAAAEGGRLSHFEVMTALAFRYFSDCSVDVAVVETGLGGVTDATNVFPGDLLQAAVITGLGLEHVEALGGNLASIAAAKAGILRPGRPLVLGPQMRTEAEEVVLRHAAAGACPVTRPEREVRVHSLGLELSPGRNGQIVRERLRLDILPESREASATAGGGVSGDGSSNSSSRGSSSGSREGVGSGGSGSQSGEQQGHALDVSVGLVGPHQHANVATAVAAVRVLQRQGWRVPYDAVVMGLREAWLPGRFQVVKLPGPEGPLVVLDGAHTDDSASGLVASLRSLLAATQPPADTAIATATATQPAAAAAAAAAATPATGQQRQVPPSGGAPARPPVALVLAMAADKEHRGVVGALRALEPRVVVFTSVPIAGSFQRAAAPGTLAGHWQAAAITAPPSQRPFRCRELVQASLAAAFDKARQELRGLRVGDGAAVAEGAPPGVIVVTGSLHAVAEAHKLPELQGVLRD